MFKKMLALAIIAFALVSCASWFTSSQEDENNPAVGGRQDSSDMLFGQAESSPVAASTESSVNTQPLPVAESVPMPTSGRVESTAEATLKSSSTASASAAK